MGILCEPLLPLNIEALELETKESENLMRTFAVQFAWRATATDNTVSKERRGHYFPSCIYLFPFQSIIFTSSLHHFLCLLIKIEEESIPMKRRPHSIQLQPSSDVSNLPGRHGMKGQNNDNKYNDGSLSSFRGGDHNKNGNDVIPQGNDDGNEPDPDFSNYVLLVALYTLQGIPMGLTASIPFLIQQKIKNLAEAAAGSRVLTEAASVIVSEGGSNDVASKLYNAQAVFALCSWPFSLKLLWAPIVDAIYLKRIGRRKTWLIPVQTAAGGLMVFGSSWVDKQLEANDLHSFDVRGITLFFFCLYFLMATQV